MTYEQIYTVIKLYNQNKGSLNDNGTVASDEQIAEWIVPSVEDAINDEEIDTVEKELKIEVPQGYEIDRQKSTFEKIVFKKSPENPITWEDYCFLMKGKTVYYTNCNNIIVSGFSDAHDKFATKKRAEQFVAFGKLLQLRDYWVRGYNEFKYTLFGTKVSIIICEIAGFSSYSLTFPTMEMAKEFKNCFSDLIKQAFPLV